MDKREYGTHRTHCCALHGCKYGEDDCPVVSGEITQDYRCEFCEDDGIKEVWQVEEFIYIKKKLETAKNNGDKNVNVSVNFLDRILNSNR